MNIHDATKWPKLKAQPKPGFGPNPRFFIAPTKAEAIEMAKQAGCTPVEFVESGEE